MTTNCYIPLELHADLDRNGIEAFIFTENSDDTLVQHVFSWYELTNRLFEYHTVPTDDDTDLFAVGDNDYAIQTENDIQQVLAVYYSMEQALIKFRERLERSKVLDRDAWLKDKSADKSEYIKDFSFDDYK